MFVTNDKPMRLLHSWLQSNAWNQFSTSWNRSSSSEFVPRSFIRFNSHWAKCLALRKWQIIKTRKITNHNLEWIDTRLSPMSMTANKMQRIPVIPSHTKVIILPTQTLPCCKRNLAKLPYVIYVCIVWSPQNGWFNDPCRNSHILIQEQHVTTSIHLACTAAWPCHPTIDDVWAGAKIGPKPWRQSEKANLFKQKKTKETKLINKEISWTTRTNHVKSTHSKELPQSPWRNCGGCFSPGELGKFAHQMQKNCLNITNWQDENFVHPRKWHTKKNIWNVESNAWFVSDQ